MCGIAGFVRHAENTDRLESLARTMAETLAHRGPDAAGVWADAAGHVALAHRRLSVLDLSSEGQQPMTSAGGRYVIVFNGEIYNHLELRAQLGNHAWRGHSDTETLLAAIVRWGVKEALKRTVGMFAVGLWDKQTHVLYLARDRLGEKPLYYGWQGQVFLFGSELKALRVHPRWRGEVDRNALASFMRYGYVPAPLTIYRDIYKLEPGSVLAISSKVKSGSSPKPDCYWSVCNAVESAQASPFQGNAEEAASELERVLGNAVQQQMVADVPLGAFLSGGIDSSTVVALMQIRSSRPVKTFTVGFHEAGYNEAHHAKAVAQYLGTEHTEMYVTSQEAMAVIPKLPQLYDEPFADSSQIPTFLISQLARQHVTVSLSGDGGDELLGGYNRYSWAANIWRAVGWMPRSLRKGLASGLTGVSPEKWDAIFHLVQKILPESLQHARVGDKIHKAAEILNVPDRDGIYLNLVSQWKHPEEIVLNAHEPSYRGDPWPRLSSFIERMMYADTVSYLPNDILVKVDRAAMGTSLETRIPFLDHRVVELAWRLPMALKVRNGRGKWLLRKVLYRHVPKRLMERPKTGFAMPVDHWLRGSLRDWAEALLDEKRLAREGWFNPLPIRRAWREHLSGSHNWQSRLWAVLMFQAWREQWP
jgi:asparagine synthase (glutamine-hydrolysing)